MTREGRLWRTLWTLIRYPGMLTTEFLAGRRRRYVRPLPLYVSLSFVLFLVMSFAPNSLINLDKLQNPDTQEPLIPAEARPRGTPIIQFSNTAPSSNGEKNTAQGTESLPELASLEAKLGLPGWLKPLFKRYYDAAQRWNSNPQEELKRFTPVFQTKLPYAAFALVPLFALSTRLWYPRRRRYYPEHFLFALHIHAFAFLTVLVATLIGTDQFGPALYFGWLAYLTIALRKWMGGRWWPQVLRAWTIVTLHSVCLLVVLLLTMVLTLPAV